MNKYFEKIHGIFAKFIKSEKLMDIIRKLFSKEIFSYLFFGVLTTVVNFVIFGLCKDRMDILIANAIAWLGAVIFSFVTNKLFVFESKSWKTGILLKEALTFAGARVLTLGIEELGLLVLIEWLKLNTAITLPFISGEMIIKIIISVVVVVLNYIFSKVLIFRKTSKE